MRSGMSGPRREANGETDTTLDRVWQAYADEHGIPKAWETEAGESPSQQNEGSTKRRQPMARKARVRRRPVAVVAVLVVAVVVVIIGATFQPRTTVRRSTNVASVPAVGLQHTAQASASGERASGAALIS